MSSRTEGSADGVSCPGTGGPGGVHDDLSFTGFLCDVRSDGSRLVRTRQPVVVTSDAPKIGEALIPLLLGEAEADRLVPVGSPSTRMLASRSLFLCSASGEPEILEVVERGRTADRRTARPRRARLADQLLARFTHEHLQREIGEPWVHGGAVVDRSGRSALVIGPSGTGKSTMIAHLVHGGFDLLNDEMVQLLRGHDRLAAFTRPVALKPGGLAHLPAEVGSGVDEGEFGALVTAAQLGGRHCLTGRPGLIVVAERVPGHDGVTWEPMGPAEALESLCANNLDLAAKPIEALGAFAWLASRSVAGRLRYADSAEAAERVGQLLAAEAPPEPADWSMEVGAGSTLVTPARRDPTRSTGIGWVPAAAVVSVRIAEELVAYHPASRAVIRLNRAGAELWCSLPLQSVPADAALVLDELWRHGFVG